MSETNEKTEVKDAMQQVVGRREATANNEGATQGPRPLAGGRCPECNGSGYQNDDVDTLVGYNRCPKCQGTGKRVMKPKASRERPANVKLTNPDGGK